MLFQGDPILEYNFTVQPDASRAAAQRVATPARIPPEKPRVPLTPLLSSHPAKNFVFHLLARHTRELQPGSVLDAGCGDLRNLRHFPKDYVGITREAALYFAGLDRAENQDWIRANGAPTVFLTALENDFSSVGAFDLCVSTHTLTYLADKKCDVIARLIERVNEGGSFIMNGNLEALPGCLELVGRQFADIELIYCGSERTNVFESDPEKSFALSAEEMNAPNIPNGHSDFYLLATQKKFAAATAVPAKKIRLSDNLFAIQNPDAIVEHELPN